MRSLLYVPADNPRFIAGAAARGADGIILDLEDSVLPEKKREARAGLAAAVAAVGARGATVLVRINAEDALRTDDATAAVRAGAALVVLPKARGAETCRDLFTAISGATRIVAQIESPGGVLDARSIARVPAVAGLICGGEDLALAMDARPEPEVLRLPKLLVHYAAKAEGKLSLGLLRTVADFRDGEAVAAAAREARAHGFDGATCVHPSLVPILNQAFSPTAGDVAWAARIIAGAGGAGAFVVDGHMVDAPVVERARRILTQAECDPAAALAGAKNLSSQSGGSDGPDGR